MDRLLRLLALRGKSSFVRYGLAVTTVLADASVRGVVPVKGIPFLLFIPALLAAISFI